MNNIDIENLEIPYLSRDLSWVDFNERVLNEALRDELPLLERFRFLSIVTTNFDEFFMVRVAALKRLLDAEAVTAVDACGLTAAEQLKAISEKAHQIIDRQYKCLREEILPGLAKNGLSLLRPDSWTVPQLDFLDSFFLGQVYPVLTPLRMEDDKPMPFIRSSSLNAAFLLEAEKPDLNDAADVLKIIVPLPSVLDRLVWLPSADNMTTNAVSGGEGEKEHLYLALLEDVIVTWGAYLFPGYRVKESMIFKINRDADFSVDEQRDEDFVEAMIEVLEGRGRADVIRMVYSPGSEKLKDELARRFLLLSSIEADQQSSEGIRYVNDYLYEVDGPINPIDFMELSNITGTENLSEKPWKIHKSIEFSDDTSMWDRISQGDVLLHLPYQSFDPVVRFFQDAASDPQVISIRTALYRTGGAIPGVASSGSMSYSPVVRALEQAALNGKHVTAVVELKARFDEERNISWANRLEKAGVIVVYGLSRLKVHAKVTLVIRRENGRINRYVHLSTGNYNDKTAKLYEDICLFTCREDIAYDAGLLFNMLTGYSDVQTMRSLVLAPASLKHKLTELIERETMRAKQNYSGKIMAKLNSLIDTDMIEALYAASQAGVHIQLCVRGICTLIPGIPGLSENIRVVSVIDHYLEHSRILYFSNGGNDEVFLSSADWMPRNLERRVELMFPIQDKWIKNEICERLNAYFNDTCQARELCSDGSWKKVKAPIGEKPFRVQKEMHARAARESISFDPIKQEYKVRRSQAL